MQGYHDMQHDDDFPKWAVYAAFLGLGIVIGMLGAQILSLL